MRETLGTCLSCWHAHAGSHTSCRLPPSLPEVPFSHIQSHVPSPPPSRTGQTQSAHFSRDEADFVSARVHELHPGHAQARASTCPPPEIRDPRASRLRACSKPDSSDLALREKCQTRP